MKNTFSIQTMLVAALMLFASQVNAQSVTAPAQGFNVFLKNGATLISNETEGPVAMGGDLTLMNSGYQVATNYPGTFQVGGKTIGLLIGGKVNYTSGNQLAVNQNTYIKIGNSTGSYVWYVDQNNAYSPIRITPGNNYNGSPRIQLSANSQQLGVSATNNPVFQGNLIDFNAAFNTMKASSVSLSACTDNATLTNPNGQPIPHTNLPNQVKITLNTGANILNLTGADMNNVQNFTFNNQPDATHYLIINVNASGTYNWNCWTNGGFGGVQQAKYILYNFYNTTTLNVQGNGAIEGTIFAPYANITKTTNQQNVEGQVIALSYYQGNAENHYAVFQPTYTGCSSPVTPPDAQFTINNASQCLTGNSFVFTNTSTGTGNSYVWTFGDGTSSTATSPTKTYSVAGTYNVKLKATNAGGSDSIVHTVTVQVPPAQPSNFTASKAIVYRGQVDVVYTVPSASSGTYTWTYSGNGATITSTTTTGNSVKVTFGQNATSGNLCVTYGNPTSSCQSASRCIAVTVKPYLIWQCTTNNDWTVAANWDGGFVPYSTISVIIPPGVCEPLLDKGNGEVRTLIVNNNNINIDCPRTLFVRDSLILNGNVKGCGYLNLKGTGNQCIFGNGTVDNFQIEKLTGTTTLKSGDSLHIRKTYKPSAGTFYTNGGFELLSDSLCTAVILPNVLSCNYIVGEVIVNKWIPGGRKAFRFLSHPFKHKIGLSQLTSSIIITGRGGADSGFTTSATNNPSAFWYNTLTGNGSSDNDSTGWKDFKNANGNTINGWYPKQGIRVYIRGNLSDGCCGYPHSTVLKLHGEVNTCDIIDTLKTNANVGYNFVGNPFAANIDMMNLVRGSNIGYNFAVWNPHLGNNGAYVTQPFNYSYILPAYSAFFTTCSGTTGNTITFPETNKVSTPPTSTLFKTTSSTFGANSLQMRITSNNDSMEWDRLLMFFDDNSIAIKEDKDAGKLGNPDLDFYSMSSDSKKLSVDFRPYDNGQIVPLGFVTTKEQDYTIDVADLELTGNAQLYLHDKFLNTLQLLMQGSTYDFTVSNDPASQGDNRFELNMADATTSIETIAAGNKLQLSMVPNPANSVVNISWKTAGTTETGITITNAVGQTVYKTSVAKGASGLSVPVNNLASGMYLVTVSNGNQTITQKLVKN